MKKVFREDLEKQSKKKVLQTDIKAIEKHFMHNFPREYIEFLLQYGHPTFSVDVDASILIEVDNKKIVEMLFSFLHPIESYATYLELRKDSYYENEPIVSKNMIPILDMIGNDGDNYIVMDLKDASIWMLIYPVSTSSKRKTFGFIANSFNEFLEKIDDYDKLNSLLNPKKKSPSSL